jgi:hypothetical protein
MNQVKTDFEETTARDLRWYFYGATAGIVGCVVGIKIATRNHVVIPKDVVYVPEKLVRQMAQTGKSALVTDPKGFQAVIELVRNA